MAITTVYTNNPTDPQADADCHTRLYVDAWSSAKHAGALEWIPFERRINRAAAETIWGRFARNVREHASDFS
jgi:hypothetical protein